MADDTLEPRDLTAAIAADLGLRVRPESMASLASDRDALRRRGERLRAWLVPADEPGPLDLRARASSPD